MDKRLRIGFIYLWSDNWLGGVYYAQNLLSALNTLDDEKKPIIDVHCLNIQAYKSLKAGSNYPYLETFIVKINIWKKILRKIVGLFSKRKSMLINHILLNSQDDVYFPWCFGKEKAKFIMWRPDFQEKHLPAYFSKKEIIDRDNEIRSACAYNIPIVFSSEDSRNDFMHFYPEYIDNPTFVVHFAVNIPDFSSIDIEELKRKYGINKNYLFCANQFWQHKNHLFLFKAFKKAVDEGLNLQLVCTGKMADYRSSHYIESVKKYISDNGLEDDIKTLGMIDKKDLLCLMKHSYAVVQPSLFEGWNTTVEECKAMNKFIFLSNLKVHQEQIHYNVCFFNPYDENDLSEKLSKVYPITGKYDYSVQKNKFAEEFMKVMLSLVCN